VSTSFAEYSSTPGTNWSVLKHILTSPAHYRAAANAEKRAPSAAMRIGSLADALVFGTDAAQYVAGPYDDYRTKAAQEWRREQEAAGRVVVSAGEYEAATRIAHAVGLDPHARRILDGARYQVPLAWTDAKTGIACKGLADIVGPGWLYDLKTARTIAPRAFLRQAGQLGYLGQLGFYAHGIEATTSDRPDDVGWIVVESAAPYDVGVITLPPEIIAVAMTYARQALDTLAECIAANRWPGIYGGEVHRMTLDELPYQLTDALPEAFDLE
jgi:hypothetical protein